MAQPVAKQLEADKTSYDGSKLFYPTYCYAKTSKLEYIKDSNDEKQTNENLFDYYMTIGLNSSIKKEGFSRKHLNLIILLDVSGSMGSPFYNDTKNTKKTKMMVANEAVVSLLAHLTEKDRFGLVTFDDKARIIQKLQSVKNINMKNLKTKILKLRQMGGTNFEKGYKAASEALKAYSIGKQQDIQQYDNRIIMLTDAQPNIGVTNPNSLLYVVAKNANDKRKMQALIKGRGQWRAPEYDYPCESDDDSDDDSDSDSEDDCDDDDDDDSDSEWCAEDEDEKEEEEEDEDDTIGLSVGGAKDVNQFRKFIQNNIQPTITSITYNGLLYQYYFKTKTRKSQKYDDNDQKSNTQQVVQQNKDEKIAPIYTTFIGVGLDFNTNLVSKITDTLGCNYFCVSSTKEFMQRMEDKQFEFMVTPLVFNLCLTLKCEGNVCQIDKVYGSKAKQQQNILQHGEIKRINTLFPSNKSKQKGGTKGGIQLIRLKKKETDKSGKDDENINVEIQVEYEDRFGKKYKNVEFVSFKPPILKNQNQNKDMIESDEDEVDEENEHCNFYDNLGIRKGVLLCRYVELLHLWINALGSKGKLRMNDEYKQKFEKFAKHFKQEMIACKDDELQKEMKIIQKLIQL